MSSSWLLKDSVCNKCSYEIVVTQSRVADFFYYCSNKECENHQGEELFDDEDCSFTLYKKTYIDPCDDTIP